jgi:hypothetical protein
MKTFVAFCLTCLVAAAGAQAPTDPATPPSTKATATTPAKKDDGKKKDAKEVKIGKIEGLEVARAEGFLGIQIVGGTFKITAYDAKKNPKAPDFSQIALRWNVNYQKAPERATLSPGGGVGVFTSEKVVKPPHSFKLFITLLKGDGGDASAENYTVDFRS